jgi:2-keto-4-pentenoate hydratase
MEPAPAAVREQLARRNELLRAGSRPVGWKLGMGERERLHGSIAVGHLTSATCYDAGASVVLTDSGDLHADVEIAVELQRPIDPDDDLETAKAAIGGWLAALEIVDLAPVLDTPVAVIATNVFHRAVAFSPSSPRLPTGPLRCAVYVNGEPRETATATGEVAERLLAAASVLSRVGERIAAGDRIITGSILQVPVRATDDVVAEVAGLGTVQLSIAGRSREPLEHGDG